MISLSVFSIKVELRTTSFTNKYQERPIIPIHPPIQFSGSRGAMKEICSDGKAPIYVKVTVTGDRGLRVI